MDNIQPKHFQSIDCLRGIAILIVVLNHAFGAANFHFPMPFKHSDNFNVPNLVGFTVEHTAANGFFGVMLFFVLSGFCIHWSHLTQQSSNWSAFYTRRFFRIIPAYWFWLIVASLAIRPDILDFMSHLALLHNYTHKYFHSIYAPFWSIAIECQIYIAYPLIYWISKKYPVSNLLKIFAVLGVICSALNSNKIAHYLGSDILKISNQIFPAYLFSWMLGLQLANNVRAKNIPKFSKVNLTVSILAGILCETHPYTCFLASVPWSIAAYQSVVFYLNRNTHNKDNGIFQSHLSKIGLVSYSIYLSHDLINGIYISFIPKFGLPSGSLYAVAISLCITAPLMILIACTSYKLIEIPGIRLGKHLIKNINTKDK